MTRLAQLSEVLRLTEVLLDAVQGDDLSALSAIEAERADLLHRSMVAPVSPDEMNDVVALLTEITARDADLTARCQQLRADLQAKLADLDRGKSAIKAYGSAVK